MKTVFVHPERCIGCKQCESACAVAHSQTKNLFLAVFESPPPKPRIHAEPGLTMNTAFPNKCRHCNPAPCMSVCPTSAIHRADDFPEIILVDEHKCIACGMCAMVCPFDVITFFASAAAQAGRIEGQAEFRAPLAGGRAQHDHWIDVAPAGLDFDRKILVVHRFFAFK